MTVKAAIDCGTNMSRLLISGPGGEVDRRLEFTRLGEGVDETGRLTSEAMRRTAEVLASYRNLMESHGVTRFRAIATSAARDAANVHEFQLLASAALGQRIDVIDGSEEAGLSFAGATAGRPEAQEMLVVDIGGGSTEMAFGRPGSDPLAISMDIGAVRVTERFLTSDPPSAEELSQAVSVVRLHLQEARMLHPELLGARALIGVAGTFTTMAAVEIGLVEYDRERVHGFRLDRAAAEDVFRTLATEPLADRRHNPGLAPERADIIVGGCVIAVGIMREFDLGGCEVSERDLLDGIVASLD